MNVKVYKEPLIEISFIIIFFSHLSHTPPPLFVSGSNSYQKLSALKYSCGRIDKYNQANNEMRNHNGKYICLARSNLISGSDDHSNFQIFIRDYLDYAFSNFISIDTRIWNAAYMNHELIIKLISLACR